MKFGSLFKSADASASASATCPGCGKLISLDDINVAKDVALCRGCGKVWSFALITSEAELSGVDFQNPPKSVRVEQDLQGGIKIIYRRISPMLLFLIPFTAVWSGLSLVGIYGTQIRKGEFDLSQSLFGLPFLLGSLVLFAIILFGLFGRWKITMRRREGNCFVGVGPFGWQRNFSFGPDARVSLEMSNYRVNNQPQEAITIQENGRKVISFGATIGSRDVKVFIAAAMNRAIV